MGELTNTVNQSADTARQAAERRPRRYANIPPLYKAMIWTSFLINAVLLVVIGVLAGVLTAFVVGRLQRFARSGFRRAPTEQLEAALGEVLS